MQTSHTYNIFYLAVTLVHLEKKYVILGNKMDFTDILLSMKNEKEVSNTSHSG